jgi:hypothetical protein
MVIEESGKSSSTIVDTTPESFSTSIRMKKSALATDNKITTMFQCALLFLIFSLKTRCVGVCSLLDNDFYAL